ncbi:MAG TPA: sigma-54 dependent transcriptional regulator [Polyangia bacterium]|jgi:two-component system response regulator PilR (NtrC family)|nr:sigma-54 dependent transcriptional regulator [Polyangia bacterium]
MSAPGRDDTEAPRAPKAPSPGPEDARPPPDTKDTKDTKDTNASKDEGPGRRGAILVVDDERSMRDFLRILLRRLGHEVTVADSLAAAQQAIARREFDLVITDLRLGEESGLDVLAAAKQRAADTQVLMVTAYATPETAIAAMKQGAYDYLTKPFKVDEVAVVLDRALEHRELKRTNLALREQLEGRFRLDRLIGKSPSMQRVFELVRKVAPARTSVLLSGESGTGKELVARALHHLAGAPRADGPFVGINCGAIPEALLESELFGHARGAFTGAVADRPGVFEMASGGTLLLDEIGELGPAMQVKLLRVLQERRIRPVGGTSEREVDVRVVAATHRDLEAEVERGAFRSDLYYRLNVIEIVLPPLRARREDIPILAEHFLRKHALALGKPLAGFEPEALAALCDYDYPGNVRELENLIERAATLENEGRIGRASLPELTRRVSVVSAPGLALPTVFEDGFDLDRVLAEVERDLVLKALERAQGVRKRAAEILGISFRSLRYRLAKLGIAPDEPE